MSKKDLFEEELKSLMDDDTKSIELSSKLINKIIDSREKTFRERINNFLNKEIEISLAPALIGIAALLILTALPKDIFKKNSITIIDIGASQVIIREKEVSLK